MKTAAKRFAVVLAAFLGMFEIVERLGVTRPESWSELAQDIRDQVLGRESLDFANEARKQRRRRR